jgi:DtxR family manganese transport transcriptional regulator
MRELQRAEVAGDYVKLIADLIALIGQAWATDVAEHPGASHGAAAKVVHHQREGLVESRPYRSIFFKKRRASIAAMSRDRHRNTRSNYLCLPREAVCHIAAH